MVHKGIGCSTYQYMREIDGLGHLEESIGDHLTGANSLKL